MKKFRNFKEATETKEGGLWDNIHKRRKAGKAPKKPGEEGYPKTLDIESKEANVRERLSPENKIKKDQSRIPPGPGRGLEPTGKGYRRHAGSPDAVHLLGFGVSDHQNRGVKKVKGSKEKQHNNRAEEAYEPITTARAQAFAKADAEPRKKVSLPVAPWDKKTKPNTKGTNVTYDKNGKVVKEDAYDSPAKKKPVSQMSSAEKKANDERRKSYKDFQKSKRVKTEGAMKRMSTGDGMDTYRKKPAESDLEKTRRMARDNVKPAGSKSSKRPNDEVREADKKKDKKLPYKDFSVQLQSRLEAFSSRAIVKKDRQGDGKPMSGHDKVAKKYGVKTIKLKDRQVKLKNFRLPQEEAMVRSNSPEHKAAVKKYIGGMKSRRPGTAPTPDSKSPRQMKDPKKDAMVSKDGKVKVVDKNLEKAHLARGYVRAEDTISKELFMRNENVASADKRPEKYTKPDGKIGIRMVPVDKQVVKTEMNMNTMKLLDKMKKASPAAKKALEAPSRVDNKDDKKVNEVSPALLNRYIKKADKQAVKSFDKAIDHEDDKDSTKHDKIYNHGLKRGKGATTARDKLVDKGKKAPNYPTGDKHKRSEKPGDLYPNESVTELTIADILKGTEKAKKRQEKERKATGKTSTSTTDLAARHEDKDIDKFNKALMKKRNNPDERDKDVIAINKALKKNRNNPNEEVVDEALDMKQRLARGRSARKNKAKMAMGRKRAGRRIASMPVLRKRAMRAARKTLTKRLTKGIAKTDLSVSRKKEIEKRLDKPAFKIKAQRLVKRTIKDIRKKEIARKRK